MTILVNQAPASLVGMTYLSMVQKLVEKCGMSGSGPTTVMNQVGELKRAVNWINEAWLNIQEMREDWQWMRSSVSFQTYPQKFKYTADDIGITDLAKWLMNSKNCTFRTYDTSVGVGSEIFLSYTDYETWRDTYQYGQMRLSYSRPLTISVAPDYSIVLGQTPDSENYTVVGDYFRAPSSLVSDTDVPSMPSRFHMLIVYKAMILYAMYEEDEYMRGSMEREFNKMLSRMTIVQLPETTFGAALA